MLAMQVLWRGHVRLYLILFWKVKNYHPPMRNTALSMRFLLLDTLRFQSRGIGRASKMKSVRMLMTPPLIMTAGRGYVDTCFVYRWIPLRFQGHTLKDVTEELCDAVCDHEKPNAHQSIPETTLREDSIIEAEDRHLDRRDGGVV